MIQLKTFEELLAGQDKYAAIMRDMSFVVSGDRLHDDAAIVRVLEAAMAEYPSFDEYIGGDVFIVETEEDLLSIKTYDLENDNATVMNTVTSWDVCNFIEGDNGEYTYALFVMITNNSGGDSFYVPKSLFGKARVVEHFLASNEEQDAHGKMSIGATTYGMLRKYLRECSER